MNIVLFVIGIWAGLCTFVAYCCVRVGSTRDEDRLACEEDIANRLGR